MDVSVTRPISSSKTYISYYIVTIMSKQKYKPKSDEEILNYMRSSVSTLVKYKMIKVIDEAEMIYDSIKLENVINDVTRSPEWFIKFIEADENNDYTFWSKLALDVLDEMNVKPTKRDMRGIYQGLSSICIIMSTDWLQPDGRATKQFKDCKDAKGICEAGYDRFVKMNKGFISLCKR